MKTQWLNLFPALLLLLISSIVQAQDGKVTIFSPAEDAVLKGSGPHPLEYEVVPGSRGDHVHVYVDGREIAVLRALKGSHQLKELAVGAHNICIKVVNRGHVPIGVEGCVKVRVVDGG